MSMMDKVDVALLSDEDIPTCFRVLSQSFGHDAPFVDSYFPHHDTSAGQTQGSKRLTAWKHASEDSTFLKAITRPGIEEEQIIGLAVWTHMTDPPAAELEEAENVREVWPNDDDREFMARLWKEYVGPRTQAVRDSGGKGVYVLELLAVHPDYQRMGAGTALVKWGTKAADELGIRAIVEGTPVGRHLYEKCGLHAEIEEMRFDVGEEFTGRTKPKLVFMTREPGS